MKNTRLSSKGQVIIPKSSRLAHHWEAGQELVVIDTDEGVLLKPARPVPSSTLEELAGVFEVHRPYQITGRNGAGHPAGSKPDQGRNG